MKALLVDDDPVILAIAKAALKEIAWESVSYTDARSALEEDLASFDIVVSDFHMPAMRGDEFLEAVRKAASHVPFVFLTINDSIGVAVELIRLGADDYIQKPIEPVDFVYRIQKIVRDKKRELRIATIEQETRLLDLEKRKLINWRILYASKDARQTEQLVANLARNINQSGGFLWLDMLSSSAKELNDTEYSIPKEILDMSITAAENSRRLLELTEFIGRVETIDIEMEEMTTGEFFDRFATMVTDSLAPIAESHDRTIILGRPPEVGGSISVGFGRLGEVMHELIVNAIKYSPPESPIRIDFESGRYNQRSAITIQIINLARELQAKSDEEDRIVGIPYDYQELIFDLFFTIEAFPLYLDEESWTDGSGLYIARKLIHRMDGWLSVHSGVDYTVSPAQPVVRMDTHIPIQHPNDD